jgi:hypothetical protein
VRSEAGTQTQQEDAQNPNILRRKVLTALQNTYNRDPYAWMDRTTLAGWPQVEVVTLAPAVKFLQSEGYLTLSEFIGGDYLAQITTQGLRLLEDDSEFNRKFPVTVNQSNTTINVQNTFVCRPGMGRPGPLGRSVTRSGTRVAGRGRVLVRLTSGN